MQINPVHALLNLIRQEAALGRSGQLHKQQIEALAELLEQGKAGELGPARLEKLSLEARHAVGAPGPTVHEEAHEMLRRSFGPQLNPATRDAINQARHESNGRGWNYTSENDNAKMALRGDASAEITPGDRPLLGVALPFTPSHDDIARALHTGVGWPPEWGEPLRLRILQQESAPRDETVFGFGFRMALAIVMMAIAYVLFR